MSGTSTNVLTKLLASLGKNEAEIIQAKYTGTVFSKMNLPDLTSCAEVILADIKIITGGTLINGIAFNRLVQLTAETLKDDYPLYNMDLFKLAIKKCAAKVITYGKDISLSQITLIMDAFLSEKQEADQAEIKFNESKAIEVSLSDTQKQNIIRGYIQDFYTEYLKTGKHDKYTYAAFNQLVKDDLVKENLFHPLVWKALQSKKKFYKQVIEKGIIEDNDPQSLKGIVEKRKYAEKLELLTELENEAMAEAVVIYFEYAKKRGDKVLYS